MKVLLLTSLSCLLLASPLAAETLKTQTNEPQTIEPKQDEVHSELKKEPIQEKLKKIPIMKDSVFQKLIENKVGELMVQFNRSQPRELQQSPQSLK